MWQASGVARRLLIGFIPTICLISGLYAPAMADDYRIESYKRSVEALIERWAGAEMAFAAQLDPIRAELTTMEQIQSPSDEEKARIAELRRQRDEIGGKMNAETDNLRLELTLVEVQEEAPQREMVSLPGWAKDIIKAKGLPIGRGIAIVPDADFDLKARKLKAVNVGISFDW